MTNIRLEACVLTFLLAACTISAETSPKPPPPANCPARDTAPNPPTSADAPPAPHEVASEVVPPDNCPACGMALVRGQGKSFLDAYSEPRR